MRATTKLLGASLVSVLVLAACGSDDGAQESAAATGGAALQGAPIKLMALQALTGPSGTFPEIPAAAEAAAAAINKAGGVDGHPIEITACDDKFDPNLSAACARKAVSEGYAAVVGSITPNSGAYIPVLAAGGVPTVANTPAGPEDISNEFSFPISATALQLVGGAAVTRARGGTSMQYAGPNVAVVVGLGQLLENLLKPIGVDYTGITLFPPPTTNFDQFASATYGAGADGVMAVVATARQTTAFYEAALSGGADLDKTTSVLLAGTFDQTVLERLGDQLDGAYLISGGQTVTDTSLPGIATFQEELEAADLGDTPLTDSSLAAWVGVHAIAESLTRKADGADVTKPATLVNAMKTVGPLDMPGWTPFDWSKPALPAPLATSFPRYFNSTIWVSKILDGKLVSAVDAPAPFNGPVTLTK